jgi:CheY-like chemotaxis protein
MEYLWVHFNLGEVTQQKPLDEILSDHEPDRVLDIPSQEDELQWLKKSQESEVIGIEDLIKPLLKTVDPLARRLSVSIELDLPDDLPKLIVAITPVRQAFLVLLTAIIRLFPESGFRINGITKGKHILLNIVPIHFKQATFTLLTGSSESISFARRLVALTGGEIVVLLESQVTPLGGIQLILPAFEQVSVLVIDDNQDALQLYQRFFTGTHYAFNGTSYPDQVLSLVERLAPNIIILDVMLPGVDGWELLSLIREHPKIHGTPVVVATILPQEELALSLGAAAYIRKPVNRTKLLKTLDALVSQSSQEYR